MKLSKSAVFAQGGYLLPRKIVALLTSLLAIPALAQLQWNSYSTSGALLTTNVASGGDAGYGGSVVLTIPASTELVFMTKTFVPKSLAAGSSSAKINFNMAASGGLYPGSTGRILGMGLLNDAGTASAITDTGYWVDFNTGNPSWELFSRPGTVTTFFQYDSADKLSTGKTATGYPSNNITYGMQFQLNMNSAATGISIGTSASSYAACGAGMTNGNGAVNELAYSSAVTPPTTGFNTFAFMFNNTSASSVNVTLSGISLVPANGEITSAPINFSGSAGSTASFTVIVNTNAVAPLSYQWYETNSSGAVVPIANGATGNGSTFTGASTSNSTLFTNTLTLSSAQVADANGSIFVVITNAYGAVTSTPVGLVITSSDTAPAITSISLTNAVIISGQGTNVVLGALGSPAPTYYWYDNNNNLLQSGASFNLALNNLQLANAGVYSVIASNYLGTARTNFIIGIIVPPCISLPPSNVLLNVGNSATFSVAEGGCATPAPTFQWYKNGNLIAGATGTNYTITSVALADIGNYNVIISNAAGSVTSSSARLAIYSTGLAFTATSPTTYSTGICYDTPLYVTFNAPVAIANSGKIRIYNATNPVTPVDTIDMSANTVVISPTIGLTNNIQPHSLFSGDSQVINYSPVIISGTTAVIYPHLGVMTSNQTYYVTMDAGIVADTNGAYFAGISNTNAWSFSTKQAGPASSTNLVVAADGSGDFDTVQGAVDSVLPGNTNYTLINVRNGNYVEIIDISGKNNLTIRGQSRQGTVIGYGNNNNLNGTTAARMAFKVNSSDIKIENLTISNSTPQGGAQAEALLVYNNGLRCLVNNCDLASRQDTILINAGTSQGYFDNCKIMGNYDYVWGVGVGYFNQCVLHTITNTLSGSYNLTAARTATSSSLSPTTPWVNPNGTLFSAYGMSFVGCTIEADSGVTGITLADANGTVGGLDSWVSCNIDTNAYVSPSTTLSNTYVFWQNKNLDVTGTTSIVFTNVQMIGVTNNDSRLLAATNVVTWFSGWMPQIAPNILTNPVSLTVNFGSPATFTVAATGIPSPTYQWQFNGTNLPGATGSSLTIASATSVNAGPYSVIVTTTAGTVTSSVATLTVNLPPNTAPIFTAPINGTNFTINVGVNVALSCTATDLDVPAQTLTYSLLTRPAGALLDPASGNFTWRPNTTQGNSVNSVVVVVTDNGVPPLSATNSFTLSVNALTPPSASSAMIYGGLFSTSVNGQVGPDYILQATTDLTSGIWTTVASTNSPAAMPCILTDPNPASQPAQFYRILVGP